MFKENKYAKYYQLITDRAKDRLLTEYTERHHIIPQSLGGTNDKDNLVELTAREHFICHWLLIKMTDGEARSKMLYALQGMKAENRYQERHSSYITAKVYERYRIEHAIVHSERMKGKEPWNKGKTGFIAHNKGKPMSDEQKRKLSDARKGKPSGRKGVPSPFKGIPRVISEEHRNSIREANAKRKGVPSPFKGIPRDESVKKKISDTKRKAKRF